MKLLFGFGVFLSLVSLLPMGLAFILNNSNSWWVFATGLAIGAIGAFCCALGIFLKLASLLFRLK